MNSDIVISTRIRLARNIKDFPFPKRLSQQGKHKIIEKVRYAIENSNSSIASDFTFIDMSNLTPTQRVSLVERHLVSPEFVSDVDGRGLLVSKDESFCIMINEEDHIRLQVITKGLSIEQAYDIADKLDTLLDENLDFAFDQKLGYLTQCPTNLGTGMRASVMLHLPALQKSRALSKIASNLSKLGMTIRGMYGESSESKGALYQLSNQVSLGISEQSAVDNLKNIASELASSEIKQRDAIITDIEMLDTICRSLGILKTARIINHHDALKLLSNVRLGVSQKVIDSLSLESIDELMCDIQPANILNRFGETISVKERDIKRADYLRERLN